MSRSEPGEYTLDDDEFEVLETEHQGPITSDEVKEKLENPCDPLLGPIEQEDFDKKGYTVSDYFLTDEDAFPRNLTDRDNLETFGAAAIGAGAIYGAFQLLTGEAVTSSYVGGAAIGATYMGYRNQEMDLDEAIDNSREYWSEKLGR